MPTQPAVNPDWLGVVVPDNRELIRLRHGAKELTLFPNRPANAALAGGYQSRFRGRGMDFDEVRAYQPGDDIRSIDWRVTARTNQTHTKIYREERERPVLLVVDLRSNMFFGSRRLKSLLASDITAALAWATLHANDRVGALIFSPDQQRDSRSRKSRNSVMQIIHHLGQACGELLTPRQDNFTLSDILQDTRRVATPGTTIVVISDFHDYDHSGEKHLFELSRHCDLTLCQISDPLEAELPPPGSYAVSDGQEQLTLNTRSTSLRKTFADHQRQRQQALGLISRRLGVPLLSLSTSQSALTSLGAIYGRNKGRSRR
jgi:uncharacterized protein (DUF58 family)